MKDILIDQVQKLFYATKDEWIIASLYLIVPFLLIIIIGVLLGLRGKLANLLGIVGLLVGIAVFMTLGVGSISH